MKTEQEAGLRRQDFDIRRYYVTVYCDESNILHSIRQCESFLSISFSVIYTVSHKKRSQLSFVCNFVKY